MRILVDASAIHTGGGGICTYFSGLLRGWKAAGFFDEWRIVATTAFPPAFDSILDAEVHRLGGASAGMRILSQQVALPGMAWTPGWKPDVVLATTPVLPLVPLPVPIVAVAYDLRYLQFPEEFGRLQLAYRRVAYRRGLRRASTVLAISEATSAAVEETTGVRSSVVYLGADHVDPWAGHPSEGHGITFAHWSNKRPTVAIGAWATLRRRRPAFSAVLHVVGARNGTQHELVKYAAEQGVSDIVRVNGHLPEQRYWELFASASVVLMPSTMEGFGLPVVEAMRLGIPVVATGEAGMREAGGNAALYAEASPESFAASCESVLYDDQRRAACISKGRRHAEAFTWTRTAAMTREVLSAAVSRRGRPAGAARA